MLWQETLAWAYADGPALNTSTTATSIIPTGAKFTLPANYFNFVGKGLRVVLLGRMSNMNPTPGTFTIDLRLGSVVACNSGALALNTTAAKTNVVFKAVLNATCRAIGNGTNANLMFQWDVSSEAFALAATGVGNVFGPASAPAVGTGFDSTAAQAVDILGTFSVSNAANGITIHQYLLEGIHGS
jgi:hypothetical protein